MRPFFPNQEEERSAAERGVLPTDYEAVAFDRIIEYPFVLPIVLEDLWTRYYQQDKMGRVTRLLGSLFPRSRWGEAPNREAERRDQIGRRIAFIELFQTDLGAAPYDAKRSIVLTHDEAEVAANGLTAAIITRPHEMRSDEPYVRTQLAAGINKCLYRVEQFRKYGAAARAIDELPRPEVE